MAKPYDVTPKTLAESFPDGWPRLLGWPSSQVTVIDADVSTVSGAADKIFRIGANKPWLLLLEFESGKLIDTVRSVRARLSVDSSPNDAPDLLASMYILMGMRYD